MKKRFCKPCIALLLSMVMIFGGGNFLISAEGETSYLSQTPAPAAISEPLFRLSVSAPRTHLRVGETVQLTCATVPGFIDFDWETLDPTVATVDSNGLVTALKPGLATIRAEKYDQTVDRTIVSGVSIYVDTSAGIQDDTTYYIMNYASGRFLSLEDSSDLPGTNVCTRPRSATTLSQWETSLLSDGRFKLRSVYSTLDQYLDAAGNEVDAFYDFGSDCVKFNIDRVLSGMYQGLYLIRYNDQYYVTQDENYNVCITSTPTDKSYWSFMKSNKGSAKAYGFKYSLNNVPNAFDSTMMFDDFEATMSDLGYSTDQYNNCTALFMHTALDADDVFLYTGHGGEGRLNVCTNDNEIQSRICANDIMRDLDLRLEHRYINRIADNKLAQARCVFYLACNSGVDYVAPNGDRCNLVDETFDKGAHFVLGTTARITDEVTDQWLEYFFGFLSFGWEIGDCIDGANQRLGEIQLHSTNIYGNTIIITTEGLPLYCRGDSEQYLSII